MRREGKYVKAIGSLRFFQGKRNIAANTICLVKDPNQIIFHQLQAISVYNEMSKAVVRLSCSLRARHIDFRQSCRVLEEQARLCPYRWAPVRSSRRTLSLQQIRISA